MFTLYLPAPLGRYYRRRKNREPIQREVEESYQASRRQWQIYLVQHVSRILLLIFDNFPSRKGYQCMDLSSLRAEN